MHGFNLLSVSDTDTHREKDFMEYSITARKDKTTVWTTDSEADTVQGL